ARTQATRHSPAAAGEAPPIAASHATNETPASESLLMCRRLAPAWATGQEQMRSSGARRRRTVASAPTMDGGVYLPQVGFSWEELRERAQCCDREGIGSLWLMDHLVAPGMPKLPAFEAWTTASALAAVTERLRIGHLVNCNGFRHPALLAKMATTLDHASGGRLNLGLGSGSFAPEFAQVGLPHPDPRTRAAQLDEALTVIPRLFTEETGSFARAH